MTKYFTKKIYLNTEKTKYCSVKLFFRAEDMRREYQRMSSKKEYINDLNGAHIAYVVYDCKGKQSVLTGETGLIFLHAGRCTAGVVSHEFGHAVLWAGNHPDKEYPIIINNMEEEELLLGNQTIAVINFYKWYWKIKPKLDEKLLLVPLSSGSIQQPVQADCVSSM